MNIPDAIIAPLFVATIIRLVVVERRAMTLKKKNQTLVEANAKLVSGNEESVRKHSEEMSDFKDAVEKKELGLNQQIAHNKFMIENYTQDDSDDSAETTTMQGL